MSIYVEARNERGDVLSELEGFRYQPLVSWQHRDRYPMLALVDPLGMTIFNRPQVKQLRAELDSIAAQISQVGAEVVGRELGSADAAQLGSVEGWNHERDFAPLVNRLQFACSFATEKYHRYLWFIGD